MKFYRLIFILLLPLFNTIPSHAQQETTIWRSGETVYSQLFTAQRLLFTLKRASDPDAIYQEAESLLDQSLLVYQTELESTAQRIAPSANEAILSAFSDMQTALDGQDQVAFAHARGRIWTNLLWLSHDVTQHAITNDDLVLAGAWLPLREYRQATSVTLVDNPSSRSLRNVEQGDLTSEESLIIVTNDLRDAYFFRLRDALNELENAIAQDYSVRAGEWAGQVVGYFNILKADYAEKQGDEQTTTLLNTIDQLTIDTLNQDWESVRTSLTIIRGYLADYQPIELSAEIIAHRGRLLYLFLDLVYVEYRDGVRNGVITIPIEYQETITFLAQARSIYEEVRPVINARDSASAERIDALLIDIDATVKTLGDSADVKVAVDEALNLIESVLQVDVNVGDVSAIFTVVDTLLNEVVTAVEAEQYSDAERTRIEAYGLFESGPELRLANRAPLLTREIEGLFWEGSGDFIGLYTLISRGATTEEITPTLEQVRVKLDEAESFLGNALSTPLAILNSAIIIIREGLEAVLIVGAILAYMYKTGTDRRFIGWILVGVAGAILLSILTWFAAETFLTITPIQRELMEGITSLIAVAVLFYVTNWLFHKTYVIDWMQFVREQANKAINNGRALGLAGLGFTVVYREGLETVLFYQALLFDASPAPVLLGFVGGLVLILFIAYLMLYLSKRLPLKPLFTVTTILMLVMAFSLTGSGVRELQEGGAVGVTLVSWFPENFLLMELFGLFPTRETLLAQVIFTALIVLTFTYSYWQGKREKAPAR